MRVENSFEVSADTQTAWALLMDVPRVIPCMPGARLVEEVDESTWKASMSVKLGPINLTFATDIHREEADEEAGRVRLLAKARELRGRGSAQATILSTIAATDGGTTVDVATDLNLVGGLAQYGRGMVEDVTAQLVGRFAECLQLQLAAEPERGREALTAQSRPISGIRLILRALLVRLGRTLRRSDSTAADGGGSV
jgi:uncharacterized protein